MRRRERNSKSGLLERWRFRRLCRRGDEDALTAMSAPVASLKAELLGRKVAIVGNARALARGDAGPLIDAADLVIRINRAPMPSARSHGTRTDWLGLATTLRERDGEALAPDRILWLSHKRKRLPLWVARRPGFFLYPLKDFEDLRRALVAPPTTGIMLIDFVSRSGAARIDLYGFDFFSSLSLSGHRKASQVPHDFVAEKAWVERLAARDARLRLH